MFHHKPDYKFMRTFGCSCFPFLKEYNKQKFHFYTSKCIFLGYNLIHKGYKCLYSSGKIYIVSHVLFNETFFPYSTDAIFSSLKPNPSYFRYNLLQSYTIFVPNNNLNNLEADAAVHGSFSLVPSSPYSHNT